MRYEIILAPQAVESLRAMALEKGLRIHCDYGIADREIHGDPDRVRQIFVNLLTNAAKFTDRGRIVISVAREMREVGRNSIWVASDLLHAEMKTG